VNGKSHSFDKVISTLQRPIFHRLISGASSEYREFIAHTKYLGVICPLLVLDRPLTGYWTLNLVDTSIPFTGVIETTSYIDPDYVGGHHLVYLPKYIAPDSPLQKMTDEEIKELWMKELEAMFPEFDRNWVRYFLVSRARYVEPLHLLNETHLIPPLHTPIKNLYLATNAQIYPALTNGESICRESREIVDLFMDELQSNHSTSYTE
jgi:protoporphyrinogen oxidase